MVDISVEEGVEEARQVVREASVLNLGVGCGC